MKTLLDEMWPDWIAREMRKLGHDVTAVKENKGISGKPDQIVFDIAQKQVRAVLTDNVRDYMALARQRLQQGQHHSGLILTSNRSLSRAKQSTFRTVIKRLSDLMDSHRNLNDQEYWL